MKFHGIAIVFSVATLLAAPSLRAQAPADACAEARTALEHYAGQAREAYVLVQYKQSEAIHRDYHAIFSAAATNKTVIKDEVLGSVGPWLQLEMPADLAALTVEQRLELQSRMHRELQRRVDLLDGTPDAELKAKLDRLNAEIEVLKARLATPGCPAAAPAAEPGAETQAQ